MNRLADALQRVTESADRASVSLTRTSGAARALHRAVRASTPGTPEWHWDRQFPVYPCPWPDCSRSWDRNKISDSDLRAEVWDHAHDHSPGEHGHVIGDRWARGIKDQPEDHS